MITRAQKSLGMVVVLIGLLLSQGCVINDQGQRVPDVATMADLAELAAFTGSSIYLAKHPDERPIFEAVLASLETLLDEGDFSPLSLHAALQKLPIDELDSPEAMIAVGSATFLWDKYAKRIIELDAEMYVAPVIRGIRNGLERALPRKPPTTEDE